MNTSQWMALPAAQKRLIKDLVLPGTHDSGTYSLTQALSQIQYSNIQFLWELNSGQAPPGFPGGGTYYVGQFLYNFIFQLVQDVSQAQDQSLFDQLSGGIRFFDLRLYYDTNLQDIYVQHGLRGAAFSTLLSDVANFVSQQGGKELIILQVSHTNFATEAQGVTRLDSLLSSTLPSGSLYTPASLDALAGTQLSAITGSGSRVIVMNTDTNVTYPSTSPVLTTTGFQNSGRNPDGVDTVSALASAEAQGLQQSRTCPLYQINWTLTPQLSDIVNEVVSRANGNPPNPVLKNLADQADQALLGFIQQHAKEEFNLITVDWYEDVKTSVGVAMVVTLAVHFALGQWPPP
jgi:hypothetical protein